MLNFETLIQGRLREEFLSRIEAILTVADANRRDAAAANFEELNEDLNRYDSVLEDKGCWQLLASLAFLSKAPVDDQTSLSAAMDQLKWVRRDGDPDAKIERMLKIKKRPR